MIKISRLADYAVVILEALTGHRDECFSSRCLAEVTHLPEPTVSKVLKILAKSGLVSSTRGAKGGYKIMHDLSSITVEDVITAIDGPIILTPCVEGSVDECDYSSQCMLKGRWNGVNEAIQKALKSVTLAEMAGVK